MKNLKYTVFIAAVLLLTAVRSWAGIARISEVKGEVKIIPVSQTALEWKSARKGMELNVGDRLKTSFDSQAKVMFYSGHSAVLSQNSDMVISQAGSTKTDLNLFQGKLRSKVKKLGFKQSYKVKTPQAVCAVRGTDFTVGVQGNETSVMVYEGRVEATENNTGAAVLIGAGQYSNITSGRQPSTPESMDETQMDQGNIQSESGEDTELREEIRKEMFEEISREAVLSRAADEIKRAEYENGKALIDAHGNRVRLEEYIVRPEDNQFKYVVLNHRGNRFDFGKILFTFDETLPDDLTLVTKNMFYSEQESKPGWILTDLVSVISNTQDQVNEEASGGDMVADASGNWYHYFGSYEFSIKGYNRSRKTLWTQTVTNTDDSYENLSINTSYYGGSEPVSAYDRPDGNDAFHLYIKDSYADGTWIAVNDYIIDDDGNIKKAQDLEDNFSSPVGESFKDYLAQLNFERQYTSSEFGGRDIDIVLSSKLLLDSGMLSTSLDND